jgi:hypothetical protein
MPKFLIDVPVMKRSFALRAFNKHETEINQHFWSFKVISDFSGFIARGEEAKNPKTPTKKVFKASGPDSERIPPTVSEWLDARDELENWLRLSALTSAASYLEVYIRNIVRVALMSDPLCRYDNGSRVIEGVRFLKIGLELPFDSDIEKITKGDWPARCAGFEAYFGSAPAKLKASIGDLEAIRRLRNNFAHGFGRKIATDPPAQSAVAASERLSEKTFIGYMGTVSKVAASIDKYLLENFIGNFELVYFYHEWKDQPRPKKIKDYMAGRALQWTLNQKVITVSEEFCDELIAYYAAV